MTLDEWTAKVAAQHELFRASKPLPGVPELLANISQQASPQVHVALASSASRPNFAIKTGHLPNITQPFPEQRRVFGSDDAMLRKEKKPAPDVFLLALRLVNEGLVHGEREVMPEECLVLEDSVAGVEAGRRAGMRVVWVPHVGLRGVWRGREDLVLEGKSDKAVDEETAGEATTEEGAERQCTSLWSRDGWAQMLGTLEDFPYPMYGMHLKPPTTL